MSRARATQPEASDDTREQRFSRLYREHYESLLAYVLRRWPDPSEAHDIVADTLVVLWRRLDAAPADPEMLAWLYGVAQRVLSNHARSRARRERLVLRLSKAADSQAGGAAPDASSLDARRLVDSLLALNDQERELVLLSAWEGLTTREIAAALGCSENAASIRMHRARKRLRRIYEEDNEEAGHKRDRGDEHDD